MKNFLLTSALAVAAFATASAQWPTSYDTSLTVNPAGQENYGYEAKTTPGGLTYVYMQLPTSDGLSMRMQIVNADGTKVLPDEGVELCSDSRMMSTMYGQCLMTDNDGNAIVAVQDTRLDPGDVDWDYEYAYTIYKVSPSGDVLWSKTLNDGVSLGVATSMKMVCTADGGYVFAYSAMQNWGISKIHVEKLDSGGNNAWESPIVLADAAEVDDYSYPYLVDAGNSEVIMVYAVGPYGGEQHLMARLIAADGTSAWGDDDLAVYDGGGMADAMKPIYTMMTVVPGPDGGALVSWMETDDNTGLYQNKLSYIKNDGTYGFATGSEGTVVSNYDGYNKLYPEVCYSPEADAFFCLFRMYEPSAQVDQALYIQEMSKEGELLLGADGQPIIDVQGDNSIGYYSIKPATDGRVVAFYMTKDYYNYTAPAYSYAALYDANGNAVNAPLPFTTEQVDKSDLLVSDMIDGDYFIANWEDANYNINLAKVTFDNVVTGIGKATTNATCAMSANRYYGPDGQAYDSPQHGLNIVSRSNADGTATCTKLMHK